MNPLVLGALAGARSMSAPALVSWHLSHSPEAWRVGGPARVLSKRPVARVLGVLALGEFVADKLPWIPVRVQPLPLAGRALTGALAGATAAAGRRRVWVAAVLGAGAALASAWAFYSLRRLATRRLGVPDRVVALAEDALVLAVGSRLRPAPEPSEGLAGHGEQVLL